MLRYQCAETQAVLICINRSQRVYLGHKNKICFIHFKTCLYVFIIKMLCPQTFPGWIVTNAEFAFNNRHARKWRGWAGGDMESFGSFTWGRALGWSFTGESQKAEASCLHQCFVLLAAAHIALTQFLSCCHQSLPQRPWDSIDRTSDAQLVLANQCVTVETASLSI